jgi:hypothetical protein
MRFVKEFITIGGGLPDFLGASCSGSAFFAPVVSVSMSVLRDAKQLRVGTAFGVILITADVGTGLTDFLAVCEVSLEICLLRLFTSWKSLSCAVDSTEDIFTAPLCLPVHTPPLWSSGQSSWLQIQRSRLRFRALPDFLRNSRSVTGSTQHLENN